jgi:hypothetical protein
LRETAEKFAQLRAEKGIDVATARPSTPALLEGPRNLGLAYEDASGASTDAEGMNGGRTGLGFGLAGRGLESMATSAAGTPTKGDGNLDGNAVDADMAGI